jgi:hypothetical protein
VAGEVASAKVGTIVAMSGSIDAVPRRFYIRELSPEELRDEEQWHELLANLS